MKCKNCGEIIADDSRFCEYCGQKVGKHRPTYIAVILGFIVIGAIVYFGGINGSNGNKAEEKKIDTTNIAVPDNPHPKRQFCFDGICIDFDMNLKELYSENENVRINRYERKGNWDEDVAEYYYDGYFYYLINDRTAIKFNDETQCISWICTKSHLFSGAGDIHVGDSWGKMTQDYPNLQFYTDYLHYNHFTRTISPATIAYDENRHVSFVFYLKQFTDEQWGGISCVSNPSGFDTQYNVNDIEYSIYQSICTTIKIDEIEMWRL